MDVVGRQHVLLFWVLHTAVFLPYKWHPEQNILSINSIGVYFPLSRHTLSLNILASSTHFQVESQNIVLSLVISVSFQIMEEYFSFVVVRNPWRRLLSCYRDKFEKNDIVVRRTFHAPYGREIMRKYRANASTSSCTWFISFTKTILHLLGRKLCGHPLQNSLAFFLILLNLQKNK